MKNKLVLVVEDNPDWKKIWDFVANLLQDGTKISWATSVSEAEQQLVDAGTFGINFDVVIADIFLSGTRTGLDFFEGATPFYQKRFLFVSSVKPEKIPKHFKLKYTEVRFLQKPFGAQQMVNELRRIIKQCDADRPGADHEKYYDQKT